MGETISVTEEIYLIPYNRKYFELIDNAPQKTEAFASPQQLINFEVDPSIATIKLKHKILRRYTRVTWNTQICQT